MKKQRARAIIFFGDQIASMYREREDRIFYSLPGGGLEGNETEQEGVVREVYEEFGIVVEPIKKVYTYTYSTTDEHFYICRYISGEFGSGAGEEFGPEKNNGIYRPTKINIKDIPSLPLMPPEIATALFADYQKNGEALRDDVIIIEKKGE